MVENNRNISLNDKNLFFLDVDVKNEDDKNRETGDEYEELYACEFCDQAFTTSLELLNHRDTHEEHTKYMEDST